MPNPELPYDVTFLLSPEPHSRFSHDHTPYSKTINTTQTYAKHHGRNLKSTFLLRARRPAQQGHLPRHCRHCKQRALVLPQTLSTCSSKLIFAPHSVTALASQGNALQQFTDTLEGNKFISGAPAPAIQQQLTLPQIKYIEAAPTPQAAKARRAKILRDPVVWQISEKQMKELQWKRKQLLQAQKKELERKKIERAKRGPPPKLGPSKKNGGSSASSQAKAPQPKAPQPPKSNSAKPVQSGAPAKSKAPAAKPTRAPSKTPAKAPAKK